MPLIGFPGVPPDQSRPSIASHPVQPVRPQLMTSLLPFLLRQLRIIAGDGARLLPKGTTCTLGAVWASRRLSQILHGVAVVVTPWSWSRS